MMNGISSENPVFRWKIRIYKNKWEKGNIHEQSH